MNSLTNAEDRFHELVLGIRNMAIRMYFVVLALAIGLQGSGIGIDHQKDHTLSLDKAEYTRMHLDSVAVKKMT